MAEKALPNKKEASPTQTFIEIEAIESGTVVLKNGGLRQILMVSGVNFDLKSEEEQGMIISSFQNFFNAIDFTIQIFIHSRKLNIDSYLENLGVREAQEPNELMKNQIMEYREFIRAFVMENAIMNKTYFVVVPYDPVKLPEAGEAITEKVFSMLKKRGVQKPTERIGDSGKGKAEQRAEHIEQLGQRVSQVVNGLNQIDLRAVPLNNEELIDLFYNLYNPESVEKKGITVADAANGE
jgi:type IV secretory pathway VirB4 component